MRFSFLFATLLTLPAVMFGQAATPAPAQAPPAAGTSNLISASHSKMYTMLSGVVIAAAEKMPEDNYSFKPTPEVRSFGQLIGHVGDSQYYFCSLAAGDAKPPGGGIEKSRTSKADLIGALKESVAYCTKVYGEMTDAKAAEMVKLMNQDFTRLAVLTGNIAHDYEHYGNMATYMRMKAIVPPTSEKKEGGEQK